MYLLFYCMHTQLTVTFISFIYHLTWCRNALRGAFAYCCIRRSFVVLVEEWSEPPNKFVLGCWGECYTPAIIILCCNNHSGFIAHRTFPSIHCTADKLTQWQSFPYDKNGRASASSALWITSNQCVSLNHLGLWYHMLRKMSVALKKGSMNKMEYKKIIFVLPPLIIMMMFQTEYEYAGLLSVPACACMRVRPYVCSCLIWSIYEIAHIASYLPLCSFLALFPPGISVLESAQRQQPAHH